MVEEVASHVAWRTGITTSLDHEDSRPKFIGCFDWSPVGTVAHRDHLEGISDEVRSGSVSFCV